MSAKDATILNHYQEGMPLKRVQKLLSKPIFDIFKKYLK